MNHYDPHLFSVVLAERRAHLKNANSQRSETPSRSTSPTTGPRTWLRRLDVAALRRR